MPGVSQKQMCNTSEHARTLTQKLHIKLAFSPSHSSRPTSLSTDPIPPGVWQGSHWSIIFKVMCRTWPGKARSDPQIIIIALKGAIRDFFFFFFNNLLTAPWTVSNTYAQVARAQSCSNHVQHIERLSRATCRVTCHMLRRDSSAIKFNRVEITFIWALFYWPHH